MLLVLGLLFVVLPIVEIYFIIQVAHVIGGWETLGLLVVESLLGAWLVKWQGIWVLGRIARALEQGRVPEQGTGRRIPHPDGRGAHGRRPDS